MKNNKCPTWAWVVIIILAIITIYLYYNSVSFEEYTKCVSDLGDSVKRYANLGIDYLDLLNCYQKDLPYCEPLILRGGNASVFKQQGN